MEVGGLVVRLLGVDNGDGVTDTLSHWLVDLHMVGIALLKHV